MRQGVPPFMDSQLAAVLHRNQRLMTSLLIAPGGTCAEFPASGCSKWGPQEQGVRKGCSMLTMLNGRQWVVGGCKHFLFSPVKWLVDLPIFFWDCSQPPTRWWFMTTINVEYFCWRMILVMMVTKRITVDYTSGKWWSMTSDTMVTSELP